MSLACDGGPAAPPRVRLAGQLRGLWVRRRFLRFVIVGGLNTAFGYGLFVLCLLLLPIPFAALCASTVLAILFNFVTTGSLVFKSRDARRLPFFFAVYAIVFLYNAAGLALLTAAGLDPRLAGLLLLPGAVALSWLLNKSIVFKRAA